MGGGLERRGRRVIISKGIAWQHDLSVFITTTILLVILHTVPIMTTIHDHHHHDHTNPRNVPHRA
jgi:hypothetical protein